MSLCAHHPFQINMQSTMSWNRLPAEMKYTIVERLGIQDLVSFTRCSRQAHTFAVPALFQDVKLKGLQRLQAFLANVPIARCQYIRTLHADLSDTEPSSRAAATAALAALLARCKKIEQLTLSLAGSLDASIIPPFQTLDSLRILRISNCAQEEIAPLSERLVVSLAASVPNLSHLTLDRISRSALHAPELIGARPSIPIVSGDEDVPPHPKLGSELSLPSLLQLSNLKVLRIRDTHLGDRRWACSAPSCVLDVLEIGSSCYVSPDVNRTCAERILDSVRPSMTELSLSSGLSSKKRGPWTRLQTLRVTPLLPLESLVDTLCALSDSALEHISVECHEDDVEDVCDALEEFLGLCTNSKRFYSKLNTISLQAVSDVLEKTKSELPSTKVAVTGDVSGAIQTLQEYPRHLQSLSSHSDRRDAISYRPTPPIPQVTEIECY